MTYQPTGNPVGRPTLYTDELAESICLDLATGERGLERICDETPGYPSGTTVWRWQSEREGFREKITSARERQQERLLYQVMDEAREVDPDTGNGNARVALARTLIEGTIKVAARLAPRRFGDKQAIDVTAFRSPLTVPPPSLDHLAPSEIAMARQLAAKALMRPTEDVAVVEEAKVDE